MTAAPDWISELPLLLERLIEGQFTSEDSDRLNTLLAQGDLPRRYYRSYMKLHAALEWRIGERDAMEGLGQQRPGITDGLPFLPPSSSSAMPPRCSPPLPLLGNAFHGAVGYFSSGWPVAYLVTTVIFGIGLLFGAVIHVSHPAQLAGPSPSVRNGNPAPEPQMQFVGRITGMVDCKWLDPNTAVPGTVAVPLGRKYALASGLMEITYNTGAKVLLQGPATYEVESKDGGYLSVGKLTARVENKEERRTKNEELSASSSSLLIPHSYFAVKTPTATVTDLGTEFGVEVDKQGVTTSHVFRGSVQVQVAATEGEAEGEARMLHENQSARVEGRDGRHAIVVVSAGKRPHFAREIPRLTMKSLDLVDVVAGGDGFSGRRGRGIDPTTGQVADAQPVPRIRTGTHQYHRVDAVPFVDGVFMPDDSSGPVQIDSTGRTFDGFGKTDNMTCGCIWGGGPLVFVDGDTILTTLGGIDYGSAGHGAVAMHANKGITFDLDAVRKAHPTCRVVRFHSIAGNTEIFSQAGRDVSADLWVIVDGQVRFQRREINGCIGAFPIDIPIDDRDRFLTLAATDGGNTSACDWIMFGDPALKLVDIAIIEQ